MKKTIGIMGGIVLSLVTASLYAQQPTWDPQKNPTVDSITAPFRGKMIPARPALTSSDYFPVIGKYVSTTNADAPSVTIALDEQNKGMVWVDGLPQGRVKAMLRKSPSTYKIPAQKTADGKDVPEGTLMYTKETGTLNIVIGKAYNSEDPALVFAVPTEGVTTDETATATTTTPANSETTSTTPTNETTAPEATNTNPEEKVKIVKTKTKVPGKPSVKTKVKVPEEPKAWTYTGTKVDATTMNN